MAASEDKNGFTVRAEHGKRTKPQRDFVEYVDISEDEAGSKPKSPDKAKKKRLDEGEEASNKPDDPEVAIKNNPAGMEGQRSDEAVLNMDGYEISGLRAPLPASIASPDPLYDFNEPSSDAEDDDDDDVQFILEKIGNKKSDEPTKPRGDAEVITENVEGKKDGEDKPPGDDEEIQVVFVKEGTRRLVDPIAIDVDP